MNREALATPKKERGKGNAHGIPAPQYHEGEALSRGAQSPVG